MDWIEEINKFLVGYKFTGEIKFILPTDKFSIRIKYSNIEVNRNYTLDYFIPNIHNCLDNIREEIFRKILKQNTEDILTNITNINNDNLAELNNKFIELRTNMINLADAIDNVVK